MKQVRSESDLSWAESELKKIELDPVYITNSAYRPNNAVWPENRIPFVDMHLAYLKSNPQMQVKDYLSNLRLKLKKTTNNNYIAQKSE